MRSGPSDVAAAVEDAPVRLRVVGEVPAGGVAPSSVEAGCAIRIATGAPLPIGADAVVQVEQTTPLRADGTPSGPRGRDATGPLPRSSPFTRRSAWGARSAGAGRIWRRATRSSRRVPS